MEYIYNYNYIIWHILTHMYTLNHIYSPAMWGALADLRPEALMAEGYPSKAVPLNGTGPQLVVGWDDVDENLWLVVDVDGWCWIWLDNIDVAHVVHVVHGVGVWWLMLMLAMLSTVDDVGWCERWFEERPEGWNDEISYMVANCQVKFHRCVREKIMLCASFLRHVNPSDVCWLLVQGSVDPPTPSPLTLPAMASSQVDGRLSSERSWTASGNLRAEHRSQGIQGWWTGDNGSPTKHQDG